MGRIVAAVLLCPLMLASLGQAPPPLPDKSNSAIKPAGQSTSATPVTGANSFTEEQARKRMQDGGYDAISEMKKGDDGIWRGKGRKSRSQFEVSVDYQGNVSGRYVQDFSE